MSKVATRTSAKSAKVGIPVSEMIKGNENWNYADLVGQTLTVENIAVGTTKKGKMCFEINLEGRELPVRIMPSQALEQGIAEVDGEDVVITATALTANETGKALLPA